MLSKFSPQISGHQVMHDRSGGWLGQGLVSGSRLHDA
jgi:hypothetical protein